MKKENRNMVNMVLHHIPPFCSCSCHWGAKISNVVVTAVNNGAKNGMSKRCEKMQKNWIILSNNKIPNLTTN